MTLQHRLNEYHLQFLRSMLRGGVRFLVIGGQVRFVFQGTATRDLDVWVDISPQNRPALDQCIASWNAKYPLHNLADFSPPLPLRAGLQITFPTDDVWFMGPDNEPAELLVADGIDILTSIGDADFNEHYARAVMRPIDGQNVPFICADDLEVISPVKAGK
jgi:hypothetical protein